MRLIISSIGTTLDTISTIGYHWCSKRPLLAQFSPKLYSFPLELKLCSFAVHTQPFNCNVLHNLLPAQFQDVAIIYALLAGHLEL